MINNSKRSIHAHIILEKPLLECMAYFYSVEINVKKYSIPKPAREVIDQLVGSGFICVRKRNYEISDKAFGYACYEYYRQVHIHHYLDQLLINEAEGKKTILDLCCGPGATIHSLVQHHTPETVYALDMNPDSLSLIKEVFKSYPPLKTRIVPLLGNAYKIPLEPDSIDYLICRAALQYLNIEVVLKEIHRVLKRNGKVFFIVHGVGYPLNFLLTRRNIIRGTLFSSVKQMQKNKELASRAKFLTISRLKKTMIKTNFFEIKTFKHSNDNELFFFPVYFAVLGQKSL